MNIRFIIIVLTACILMAAPVDLNRAQRVAGNIYPERSIPALRIVFIFLRWIF